MSFLMKAYGIARMFFAITLIELALTVQLHEVRVPFHHGVATFVGFGIFCLLLCPAVHTYGTFLLVEEGNSGIYELPDPEVRRRFKLMESRFPFWNLTENFVYISIGFVFVFALIKPDCVEPFLFFCGALCLLAGLWTVFGLPYAMTTLEPLSYDERVARMADSTNPYCD